MYRTISNTIESKLKRHRIIIMTGQRQVGKTYEIMRLKNIFPDNLYFDFEDVSQAKLFNQPSIAALETIFGNKNRQCYLLLDEIQLLPKIGSVLKLIHDHFPNIKVVATGSAAFLLLKDLGDSLYGRCIQLEMFPLTFREMIDEHTTAYSMGEYKTIINKAKITSLINTSMLYGTLPRVFLAISHMEKKELLLNYYKSLIFKDVFEIEGIRNPRAFKDLLRLLALQIGSEINPNELAQQLSISRPTVIEYIDLFEKFKIIYVLRTYNTNQRNEIKKNFKVYFVDLGIRNAALENFLPIGQRNDIGGLFENLVMNLFRINTAYFDLNLKQYFWRNFNQAEVDMVLHDTEKNQLHAAEIKFKSKKLPSNAFYSLYKKQIQQQFCINKENFWQYI